MRIALVENEQRIRQAARNIRRFLETGAGKVAQRRPSRHAALDRRHAFADRATLHHGRRRCKVGLAGLGTVGASVVAPDRARSATRWRARCGRPIEVVAVTRALARQETAASISKARAGSTTRSRLRADPGIDVFVELIGGDGDPAKRAVEAALEAGKPVVTANKALLAQHGVALAELAEKHKASRSISRRRSAGGIPIVKTLREALAGNSRRAHLRHPQRHLQLHPDPHGAGAAVVRRLPEGGAAARLRRGRSDLRHRGPRHRAEARRSWRASPSAPRSMPAAIYVEGISSITPADLEAADELGYRIKLLGVA